MSRRAEGQGGRGLPSVERLAEEQGRPETFSKLSINHTQRTTHQSEVSLWDISRFIHYVSPFGTPVGRRASCSTLHLLILITLLTLISCRTNTTTSPQLAVHTIRPDDRSLAMAQAAGFDTVVQLFPWREVEPTRDQFHWEMTDQFVAGAEYYGLDVVIRLDQHPAWASQVDLALNAPPDDLQDYYNFVYRVAGRYRGRVKAYIIWNEPNLAVEWGGQRPDPTAFSELLKKGYQAVKAADPEALVVSAGLAPTNSNDATAIDDRLFLAAMYQAGAGAYFDVLGTHAYSFGQAPHVSESDSKHPAFRRLAELRQIMVAHGDAGKPVWITEMGWTTEPPADQVDIGVSLEQQADYLVAALEMIRRDWAWVKLVTIWNLSRPQPGDPFGGYSLLDASGEPRPAYAAWQQAAGSRAGRGLPTPIQMTPPNQVSILAPDALIHLGDSVLPPPWWPLYGGHNPSLAWIGGFYLSDPGSTDWTLSLELRHQNEVGNTILVNDVPLPISLPQQDFTRRWLTVQFSVPASRLRPGYNEITFTSVRLLPDAQQDGFVWDDFEVRNIRLVRAGENLPERTFNSGQ
ncbi:MAG: endo-1,4-beta-xylanase [Anaerolineae bacterium]|nr:endo-1,4-beta-xylanase [Anaerolineae bacterium]